MTKLERFVILKLTLKACVNETQRQCLSDIQQYDFFIKGEWTT